MNYKNCIILLFNLGCVPGGISVDDGSTNDGSTDGSTDDGADEVETDDEGSPDMLDEFLPGEMWGPCPIDESSGSITLCTVEGVACVPSQAGTMCLPIADCPPWPGFSTHLSMGWGYACYPRCDSDDDCAPGMVCDTSLNFESMCSWPNAPSCAGSLGCECDNDTCAENLNCVNDLCISCPVGQVGCDCGPKPGYTCDVNLVCVAGTCEFN
jgi:hypothetical protein